MESILAILLQARDVAHVMHWRTKSFAKHMALGELYELLTTFTDQLAEMAIGEIGDSDKLNSISWDQASVWDKNNPNEFLAQLHMTLEKLKPTVIQKDWLINKYEELQGEVARVKYKIDNLL